MMKNTIHIVITFDEELFDKETEAKFLKGFDYDYTDNTKVKELYMTANEFCGFDISEFDDKRFSLLISGNYEFPQMSASLASIIHNFGFSSPLVLHHEVLAGGIGIETKNGIRYYLNSNEHGNTPHIHAEYQGESISIDLLTFKITGEFHNKKKQAEAVKYAKDKRAFLLEKYAKHTNGLVFEEFFVVNGETIK